MSYFRMQKVDSMTDHDPRDKRQKLIDDAMAQCQQTRKTLEQKMPQQFEKIRLVVKDVSQEANIRSGIANLKHDGEEKARIIETVEKYLELSISNPIIKQSIKALLQRHKH